MSLRDTSLNEGIPLARAALLLSLRDISLNEGIPLARAALLLSLRDISLNEGISFNKEDKAAAPPAENRKPKTNRE